jgi:hypothetical protein
MLYTGAVVDAVLDRKEYTKDQVELLSHRKMKQVGHYVNTNIKPLDMYTLGKWSVFHYHDGTAEQLDWEWDAQRSQPKGTVDEEIKPQKGPFYGIAHAPGKVDKDTTVFSASRYAKEKGGSSIGERTFGVTVFRAYLDAQPNVKAKGVMQMYENIEIPNISIVDEFQIALNDLDDITIVEKRNGGEYLNFYVLKNKDKGSSYTYEAPLTRAINLEFKAIDFTTVYILKKVVVFYTTIESVQIGFVIFDPLGVSAPVKGLFPADTNRELVPYGIDCLVSKTQNNQVQCFVDTVGPINYEVLYTIGQTDKADGFVTNGVLVEKAAYNSPRGFERIKTVQGHDMTGVLYKNNQVEPAPV